MVVLGRFSLVSVVLQGLAWLAVGGGSNILIQKRLGQFFKTTETTSQIFKTVSPPNKLEILSIHLHNHKYTVKNMIIFNQSLWKAVLVREESASVYGDNGGNDWIEIDTTTQNYQH